VNARNSTLPKPTVSHAIHATVEGAAKAVYDADSCRNSWESYVQSDIQTISEYSSIAAYARLHSTSTVLGPLTTSSIINVATGPTWQECDGKPRRKFLEQVYTTIIQPNMSTSTLYNIQPAPSEPPESMTRIPPYPSCSIAPQDCQQQWNSFKDSFNTFKTVDSSNISRGIDYWVAERYVSRPVGLFSGCSQPTELCFLGVNNTSGFVDLEQRVFEERGCDIQVGRFVLIYFPPQSIVSRDLCANDGWGTASTLDTASYESPVKATLKQISFRKFTRKFRTAY
jgi:hypothetical protein